MQTIAGIVEFPTSIYCATDSLGKSVKIELAGHKGTLSTPALPTWNGELRTPLLGPQLARKWKRGNNLIQWGMPTSGGPKGYSTATIDRALMEFSFTPQVAKRRGQELYESFPEWLELFELYVILQTKQHTRKQIAGGDAPGRLELEVVLESGLKHIPRTSVSKIQIMQSGKDESLHHAQLKEAARLASLRLQPRLEYRLLLEAYYARRVGDLRKAIIEAANAMEVCLSSTAQTELTKQKIPFGDALLKKFRMLSGRLDLIRILGVPIPKRNYELDVLKPRNDVMHKAEFPEERTANQVIERVEELLGTLCPTMHE